MAKALKYRHHRDRRKTAQPPPPDAGEGVAVLSAVVGDFAANILVLNLDGNLTLLDPLTDPYFLAQSDTDENYFSPQVVELIDPATIKLTFAENIHDPSSWYWGGPDPNFAEAIKYPQTGTITFT